jgi:hypothetical protein
VAGRFEDPAVLNNCRLPGCGGALSMIEEPGAEDTQFGYTGGLLTSIRNPFYRDSTHSHACYAAFRAIAMPSLLQPRRPRLHSTEAMSSFGHVR